MPIEDPQAISLIESYSTGLQSNDETSITLFEVVMILFVHNCRDGVSEGQFSQVLLHEMDAIRKVFFL